MFEPLFMMADVPGDVAAGVAGAGGLAIVALWRRLGISEAQRNADTREFVAATKDAQEAVRNLTRVVESLDRQRRSDRTA